ncbi:MAG: glycosyltransferase family 4 protein [Cyclobacteriaceae bacterium]
MSLHPEQNILLVWNRMGDYHRARWNTLQSKWTSGKVHASDLGAGDSLYQWENTGGDDYVCLSDQSLDQPDLWIRFRNFKKYLRDKQISTVCIPGYGRKEYVLFLIWCKWKNIKVILFAESWYGKNPIVNRLKSVFLKWVCQRYFVSGINAEKHFHEQLKIPKEQIRKGYSVVDNDHFGSDQPIKSQKILLCVARFSEEKNHQLLFDAFLQSKLSEHWILNCVGAGPLLEPFQELQKQHLDKIKIEPWASYDQLPAIYQKASAFILPSTFEPWGLVVNEAMAAGLPIIATNVCGCVPDLIKGNGWVFNPTDKDQLVRIFNQMHKMSHKELEEKGMKSKEIICQFDPGLWADHIIKLNRDGVT